MRSLAYTSKHPHAHSSRGYMNRIKRGPGLRSKQSHQVFARLRFAGRRGPWLASGSSSQSVKPDQIKTATYNAEDYVGSEACKDCHEDQFKAFSHTSHAQLATISSWKGKVTGCEACHGPGKAHSEEGDPDEDHFFQKQVFERNSQRLVLPAMPAEKSTTTSGAANTGATTSDAQIAIHRIHPETGKNVASSNTFISPANAREAGLLNGQAVENERTTALHELPYGSQSTSLIYRSITRFLKER